MFLVDTLILISGMLLLIGIASSKLSARLGLPVLVLFLLLGMLAGEEGIGGIAFENYALAQGIGSLALALILFDGGLGTPVTAVRLVWRPATTLATVGVLITALVTGAAAAWILGIPLVEGLLLGSIVGSTDAAAVFSILRSGGISLAKRLAATLELESGSNDPMAVFLTIGCIEILLEERSLGAGLPALFASQMVIGAAVGIGVGFFAVRVVNRINLDAAGLYPVLVSAFGLLAFGLAAGLGGSGFLAVYLAGIVIGNSQLVFRRGIRAFHDAGAWFAQIVMFIVLGLLSFPSRLVTAAPHALLIGAVLILVARPLAVACTMPFFRFSKREMLFVSWVGLKGAVPITLATYPLLFGIRDATLLFDVVFFVVVLSAVVQGWTLPVAARWLGLEMPPEPEPPVTLEINSLKHVDGEVVDYTVGEDSRAAGRRVRDLALPEGAVIALVARKQNIIPPHGNTVIEPGDHVILVLRPNILPLVTRVFGAHAAPEALPPLLEFPLRPSATVGELEDVYGITMGLPPHFTLDEALRQRLGPEMRFGSMERFGPIALYVRELTPAGTVERVGMVILPSESAASPTATPATPPTSTDARESAMPGDAESAQEQPTADAQSSDSNGDGPMPRNMA